MNHTLKTKFFKHILMLLGFSTAAITQFACAYGPLPNDYTEPEDDMLCMYGTPVMDFVVSGKVVNQSSSPIAGINVSYRIITAPGVSSVLTAEDGTFLISGTGIRPVLEFKDVDGAENGGEFADKKETINADRVEEGDGKWYLGKYEAKGVVIEMEEKK